MNKKVVNVAFIKEGKLLIVQSVRSSKNNIWTLIGGGIEDGESEVDAAIREIKEEFHNGFEVTEGDLVPLMGFKEGAASDPNITMEMTIFICKKPLDDVVLFSNYEILKYHWYKVGDTEFKISSAIRDHFLPYAISEGLIY